MGYCAQGIGGQNRELPYKVENSGGPSKTEPPASTRTSPIWELHGPTSFKSDVPSSQVPLEFGRETFELPPVDYKKIPKTPKLPRVPPAHGRNSSEFHPPEYPKLRPNQPSPEVGLNPVLVVTVVGMGGLFGLSASIFIVKNQLAGRLAARPNGDRLRSKSFTKGTPSEGLPPPFLKSDVFQLQTAIRRQLISNDEYRALRNKYLLPANFSFSLLVPTLLALAYLSLSAINFWVVWVMSSIGAVVTALLTTYALDRRHQFRSEYRTLIVENLQPKLAPDKVVPTGRATEGVSAEESQELWRS